MMIANPDTIHCAPDPSRLYLDQLALVRCLCDGDPEAFRQIDGLYRTRLYRLARKIVKGHQDAEDAVQETFLRAFLKFDTFHGRSSIYTWLASILINCCLVQLRKNKKHLTSRSLEDGGVHEEPQSILVAADDISSEGSLINAEQVEILDRAIKCLRADFRFILNARTKEELPLEEIALQLQLSLAATKSRALRARKLAVRNARAMMRIDSPRATSYPRQ